MESGGSGQPFLTVLQPVVEEPRPEKDGVILRCLLVGALTALAIAPNYPTAMRIFVRLVNGLFLITSCLRYFMRTFWLRFCVFAIVNFQFIRKLSHICQRNCYTTWKRLFTANNEETLYLKFWIGFTYFHEQPLVFV